MWVSLHEWVIMKNRGASGSANFVCTFLICFELSKEPAKSSVPVLNELSSLWHPMQILANLLTLHEYVRLFTPSTEMPQINEKTKVVQLPTVAYCKPMASSPS